MDVFYPFNIYNVAFYISAIAMTFLFVRFKLSVRKSLKAEQPIDFTIELYDKSSNFVGSIEVTMKPEGEGADKKLNTFFNVDIFDRNNKAAHLVVNGKEGLTSGTFIIDRIIIGEEKKEVQEFFNMLSLFTGRLKENIEFDRFEMVRSQTINQNGQ